ncbi:MAG TPA: zf-HC2 domain-containing protein [Candidatus Binataceae bacterium]|nr:zf-HC2 domain-containing protein [Candidatus Binataceae bacterium]
MARCEDIELLLGPFEDHELEPHEMQEVARHTGTCSACEGVLADYRTMAAALRGAQKIPNLEGFASGVMARIQSMELPAPVPETKRHWYDSVSGWFANTIMMGGLAAAVAVATAIVITPEIAKFLHIRQAHAQHPQMVASNSLQTSVARQHATLPTSHSVVANVANDDHSPVQPGNTASQMAEFNYDDAGTEISSLNSDSPSVAVWTAPENKTTVVWVPDQQP